LLFLENYLYIISNFLLTENMLKSIRNYKKKEKYRLFKKNTFLFFYIHHYLLLIILVLENKDFLKTHLYLALYNIYALGRILDRMSPQLKNHDPP